MPTLGSLFDGIGGFPLAAVRNGIEPVWASEIEAFPIEVTRKRFPSILHVGDITKLNGAELPPVDIITGGSPCQDLSVAGARAGLAGERSGLFMEQIRVVKEMRDADERRGRTAHTVRPRYMCWENVPGSFSSAGGEDFRIVLEEIVRIKDGSCSVPRPDSGRWESAGAIILGNQFSLAWRVMDAQFWGVAQRRKRIFLVADFAGRSAPQILFEQNRLPGYSASSGGQRQGTAASAPGCSDPPGGTGPIGFDGYNGDLTGEKAATLGVNCGMSTGRNGVLTAFAANQRDEVRDLHGVAGALQAQPGMKQQTFVASFSAGAGASAGSIAYNETVSPTLKGSASGNCMPSVLCINDQGGKIMECSEDVTGTLRAQEHGHQPLVLRPNHPMLYENHGIDGRYTGPHDVAPTMSARYGTGGNNVPLVQAEEVICITGNAIDRQPQYGGNGIGWQRDIAYTLTATDRHSVFSRQRVDQFKEDDVASTESARQYKDATDIVCRPVSEWSDAFCHLLRRLVPLECERLQGYPDGWTDVPGASDSARYKALGNSVAIPCVEYLMERVALVIALGLEWHL